MTYTQIGLGLIAFLFLAGVFLNIVVPTISAWFKDFVQGLNGDTYADNKSGWD